jgi:hypothetical protein
MKYEPASIARSELARRITARATAAMRETKVIVAAPGEPPPGQSALDRLQQFDEQRALAVASKCPALRQTNHGGFNMFVAAKHSHCGDTSVHRHVIQRLVDKQLMEWGNSAHSFAILTQRGRGEP